MHPALQTLCFRNETLRLIQASLLLSRAVLQPFLMSTSLQVAFGYYGCSVTLCLTALRQSLSYMLALFGSYLGAPYVFSHSLRVAFSGSATNTFRNAVALNLGLGIVQAQEA